jgi:hypothetical protein
MTPLPASYSRCEFIDAVDRVTAIRSRTQISPAPDLFKKLPFLVCQGPALPLARMLCGVHRSGGRIEVGPRVVEKGVAGRETSEESGPPVVQPKVLVQRVRATE